MYIVTGGAGFIGSATIWALNGNGIREILIVDNLANSEKWKNLVNRNYLQYMNHSEFMSRLYENPASLPVPEAIIHMGACSSTTETNADFLMSNNTHFSIKLCEFAITHNARFINASSAATYGDGSCGFSDNPAELCKLTPLNMYAYSKHLFDLWLQENNWPDKVASLKFFNVYGPNEYHKDNMRSMVCKTFEEIKRSGKAKLFKSTTPAYPDGEQMRDFVYVKDCIKIIEWLLKNPGIKGLFNVGTGKARTWKDLVNSVFNAMELPPDIEYISMPKSLHGKYQNYTQAEMDWMKNYGNPIKFTSLEDGVKDYIRNYLGKKDPYLEKTPESFPKAG